MLKVCKAERSWKNFKEMAAKKRLGHEHLEHHFLLILARGRHFWGNFFFLSDRLIKRIKVIKFNGVALKNKEITLIFNQNRVL